MDPVLYLLIPYLLNLAAGLRSGEILAKEQQKFNEKLAQEKSVMQLTQDRRSLREQLRLVGTETARITAKTGNDSIEKHMLMLLTDEVFQEDMAEWLTAWKPFERKQAQAKLAEQMVKALHRGGAKEGYIQGFKDEYFDRIEKVVFSDPVLANWRLTLALYAAFDRLDELEAIIRAEGLETRQEVRDQHRFTRKRVEEMAAQQAGLQFNRFNEAQRRQAEQRYRELALESCDIMDLHNLPESDRHMATRQQELKLRRLYVPLRIRVEIIADQEPSEADLEKIEKQRNEWQRLRMEGKRKESAENKADNKGRVPVGKRLKKTGRLVLLGDPGSGKTTLIRWIATAYLLRLKEDPAWKDLPDVATLPNKDWLPIVVRCRDLDEACKK